jgi:hypothetical protein
MDQHSILDRHFPPPAGEGDMPGTSPSRSAPASGSAGIASANAHLPQSAEPGARFPGEDGGRSLAEMAHIDLDAALQLLAERAQYITGGSGAAIALRRGEHNDMLCRASAGSNAPELGALLSMEYGFSGESVRTRQTLRCDDTECDPRVNREGCRQLGIASVVVMPIVNDEQVLGVFELFSGKPRAFDERDISALQRLSEMVETAVKHAVAAQSASLLQEPVGADAQQPVDGMAAEAVGVESPVSVAGPDLAPAPPVNDRSLDGLSLHDLPPKDLPPPESVKMNLENVDQEKTKPETAPKKPLFWSAASQTPASATGADQTVESIPVPPVLRNLQKCQACGFPVSQGRTLCVECEEKQWRGQRLPAQSTEPARARGAEPALAAAAATPETMTPNKPAAISAQAPVESSSDTLDITGDVLAPNNSTLFVSSTTPSESWLVSNKYILGALLVVALIIGVILGLR